MYHCATIALRVSVECAVLAVTTQRLVYRSFPERFALESWLPEGANRSLSRSSGMTHLLRTIFMTSRSRLLRYSL